MQDIHALVVYAAFTTSTTSASDVCGVSYTIIIAATSQRDFESHPALATRPLTSSGCVNRR
jgi:hypothetical protein